MNLTAEVLDGNRLALARLLTQIENETTEGLSALDNLFPYTGNAHLIGVTGAPGTGKSSLVNQVARYYRQPLDGTSLKKVAIVAVDPSSPFSGGAVLGDERAALVHHEKAASLRVQAAVVRHLQNTGGSHAAARQVYLRNLAIGGIESENQICRGIVGDSEDLPVQAEGPVRRRGGIRGARGLEVDHAA